MVQYIDQKSFARYFFCLACSHINFSLMFMVPADLLAEKSPSAATLEALNQKYGLDQPKIVQYKNYMLNLLKGGYGGFHKAER